MCHKNLFTRGQSKARITKTTEKNRESASTVLKLVNQTKKVE